MAEAEIVRTEVKVQAPEVVKSEGPMTIRIEQHAAWPVLSRLPMQVSAEIALENFKVRDLLALETGSVIQSGWLETEDVTVKAGGVQVGWSEFEVEDQQLLVRLTRLA